jgi:hypothetical protein
VFGQRLKSTPFRYAVPVMSFAQIRDASSGNRVHIRLMPQHSHILESGVDLARWSSISYLRHSQ